MCSSNIIFLASSTYKFFFLKSGLLMDLVDPLKTGKTVINYITTESKPATQQSVAIDQSSKFSGQKRKCRKFIPVCHFCSVKSHIKLRCSKVINFLENNYLKKIFSKSSPKNTQNPKLI